MRAHAGVCRSVFGQKLAGDHGQRVSGGVGASAQRGAGSGGVSGAGYAVLATVLNGENFLSVRLCRSGCVC